MSISGTGGSPTTTPERIDFLEYSNRISECGVALFIGRPVSGRIYKNVITDCDAMQDIRTGTVPMGGNYADFKCSFNSRLPA